MHTPKPPVRTFVLKSSATRDVIDSTLPMLVAKVEGRIRRHLPECSAFTWHGPGVIEGYWSVVALDSSHGALCEYDLFLTGKRA